MSSDISSLTEWIAAAAKLGQQTNEADNWPQIAMGTEQHKAWLMYFHDNGLPLPVALNNIHMSKARTWTAPCEWPHQLKFVVRAGSQSVSTELLKQARECHQVLRALALDIRNSNARFALLRYPLEVRKRAMEMFPPGEPKPALTTIEYRTKDGRVITSGEPYFLPPWDGAMPPGGPGGDVTRSLDSENGEEAIL